MSLKYERTVSYLSYVWRSLGMDFVKAVQAVVPGTQGRALAGLKLHCFRAKWHLLDVSDQLLVEVPNLATAIRNDLKVRIRAGVRAV